MATDTDRYAPLRDASSATANPTQETPPGQETGKNQTEIERTSAAHEARHAAVAIDEHGQPTRWPANPGLHAQSTAALELVKLRHVQRQNAGQEPEPQAPEPQKADVKRELSFFEDRNPAARNFGELKREHADGTPPTEGKEQDKSKSAEQAPTLAFYEDRNPEQSRTR